MSSAIEVKRPHPLSPAMSCQKHWLNCEKSCILTTWRYKQTIAPPWGGVFVAHLPDVVPPMTTGSMFVFSQKLKEAIG